MSPLPTREKNDMRKKLLALAVLAVASTNVSAGNVAGDKLDYYKPERPAIQTGAEVIDLTGKGPKAVAEFLATVHRLEADEEVLQIAKNSVANNKKIAPEYAEIMEMQAKIRGVEVHELYAALLQMDWSVNKIIAEADKELRLKKDKEPMDEHFSKIRGCTTIAFNDSGIVAQNNDLGIAQLKEFPTRLVKTDDVMFIPTDGGHFQGMGRHVGVVLNIMGEASAKTAAVDADNLVTIDAVFASITHSKSVEDAISRLQGYTTPVAMNFTVADDSGDSAALEISAEGLTVVRGDGGIGHGNHNAAMKERMLGMMTITEANEIFVDSFAREAAAQNFVDFAKEKTVDGMKYILNQKPINITLYDKDFVTVETMIFDTKNGCAHVSGDNPLFGEYSKVCFD
jgi:hypothetical protein